MLKVMEKSRSSVVILKLRLSYLSRGQLVCCFHQGASINWVSSSQPSLQLLGLLCSFGHTGHRRGGLLDPFLWSGPMANRWIGGGWAWLEAVIWHRWSQVQYWVGGAQWLLNNMHWGLLLFLDLGHQVNHLDCPILSWWCGIPHLEISLMLRAMRSSSSSMNWSGCASSTSGFHASVDPIAVLGSCNTKGPCLPVMARLGRSVHLIAKLENCPAFWSLVHLHIKIGLSIGEKQFASVSFKDRVPGRLHSRPLGN